MVRLTLPDGSTVQPRRVRGLVDSGASRTLLPMDVAADLGIDAELLIPEQEPGTGVQGSFSTWSYPPCVLAQILLEDGQPGGPLVHLHPGFAASGFPPLLGRRDFFA